MTTSERRVASGTRAAIERRLDLLAWDLDDPAPRDITRHFCADARVVLDDDGVRREWAGSEVAAYRDAHRLGSWSMDQQTWTSRALIEGDDRRCTVEAEHTTFSVLAGIEAPVVASLARVSDVVVRVGDDWLITERLVARVRPRSDRGARS